MPIDNGNEDKAKTALYPLSLRAPPTTLRIIETF